VTDWDETTSIAQAPEPEPEKPERDRAYLIVLAGSGVGEMHKIGGESILGRGREAQLRFLDDGISRVHCRVYRQGDKLVVEDCGSRNGTFCNGQQLSAPRILRDGDKIQIGRTTILKFTYHDHLDESFQQQMYDSALRDSLTKVYNKRYFNERLDSEFQFSERHDEPLSLLLLDLDHFKPINDRHGHLAGDHALVQFARHVQRTIRNEDVLARYGGEEFAIISRAIPHARALVFAERVRGQIEKLDIQFGGQAIPLTVSIGVATMPAPGIERPIDLVEAADRALYAAKHAGRNAVRAWTP
jgi:two-component system, cell cycle response regulator